MVIHSNPVPAMTAAVFTLAIFRKGPNDKFAFCSQERQGRREQTQEAAAVFSSASR